ncbi:thiamine ABC transporter substrate binding subunit [Haemophilus influenzae]|uniref:thiamine ABC transporter substrate binding subunit n=1 Tax=Haemophilus influenzae TaxID=727 RepID=UPI0005BEBF06|nr:thiamine ABC transporter substrate binding subunit [Haemophilus influenzae]AJO87734.1 Thiamine-binding periplasmic protein precursor [Haemophilus influenzae]MCK9644052.1 thiamine ABC transporter substrate binding subunit [Haemophilus influenzae]PRI53161.1 Thiamine-binding periplasmic protein precursor [Haemophilus influenzae]PRI99163.1 Thiamine-binding periplasmic protein precursor [Haemophilus influenzae]PRJ98982.1 Thiamine-binding periplasmic protein precursor [Haemophilus influenzae]
MNLLKLTLISTALFSTAALAQSQQSVNVYSYDSFTSEWGAGPKVKQDFEKAHPQCTINFTPFESVGVLLNRVRLEGKKTKADIVLGLDNFFLEQAEKTGIFAPNNVDLTPLDLPTKWTNKTFLPFDFGNYAFVYDKTKLQNPPKSLKELVERQDLRVIYQDPRTSSVGRGLLVWMNVIYPEDKIQSAWKNLGKHTVTVGKGWSDTYGAFLKGEADLVLSYSTSPLYHQLFEKKDNYAATDFAEGHITQVELAARVANHPNQCADDFMAFLISPTAQKHIVTANIMLPVIQGEIEPHFDALKVQQKTQTPINPTVNPEQLKNWISTWQTTLTK